MRISLIYLHVIGKSQDIAKDPSYYRGFMERFAESYRQFKPAIPHELRVVFCKGDPVLEDIEMYRGTDAVFDRYDGTGWDCGAHQDLARRSEADLVLCLSTPAYLWRQGWLEPFVAAFRERGEGLYGAMGSCEHTPHIRTSAYAFTPKLAREYPHLIDSRETCFHFESGFTSEGHLHEGGSWSFTNWVGSKGLPVLVVTESMVYPKDQWRQIPNGFRNGDQSNCLIRDRHWDIYQASDPHEKQALEALKNGIPWQQIT